MLTTDENRAIKRLKRSFSSLPGNLCVYLLDSTIYVCKRGVSCDDIAEHVVTGVEGCVVLKEMHDELDFGYMTNPPTIMLDSKPSNKGEINDT